MQRTWGDYDALLNEVNQVRQADRHPEQWMVAQLKTMVKWYKHDGDDAIPAKKNDLLTKYHATSNRGAQIPPPMHVTSPLPPAVALTDGGGNDHEGAGSNNDSADENESSDDDDNTGTSSCL